MMKRILRLIIISTITAVFLLTACQMINQDNLSGSSWRLTELNGSKPLPETKLTIEFDSGEISGRTGCNQYGGQYNIDGEKINFSAVYNTEMACQNPEGIMEQEQVYLESLREAIRFSQTESNLFIFDSTGKVLIYEPYDPDLAGGLVETAEVHTPTAVAEIEMPTLETPGWEHHVYRDQETGITILIPDTWIVTGIIEGEYAILQSYPEDKYIGGEPRDEGDTKCDLNIRPEGSSLEDLVEQWTSSSMTEILSDEPFLLANGVEGRRFEIQSLGKSIAVVVELEERLVVLSCFGEFDRVDEIASTLTIGE